MTFIYEVDSYSRELLRMCKCELPMSRLPEVIVWHTYRQTNKLRVVTSIHAIKAITHHSIRRIRKPHATCKPDYSLFYRTGVMCDRSLQVGIGILGRYRFLWPWPWPDDLHIRTWPVLSGDMPDVQIWTSHNVKAFEIIVRQIQTDIIDRNNKPGLFAGVQQVTLDATASKWCLRHHSIRPVYDLDLWPLTLKTFSAIPSGMIWIFLGSVI